MYHFWLIKCLHHAILMYLMYVWKVSIRKKSYDVLVNNMVRFQRFREFFGTTCNWLQFVSFLCSFAVKIVFVRSHLFSLTLITFTTQKWFVTECIDKFYITSIDQCAAQCQRKYWFRDQIFGRSRPLNHWLKSHFLHNFSEFKLYKYLSRYKIF